jgi:hypothetical protein
MSIAVNRHMIININNANPAQKVPQYSLPLARDTPIKVPPIVANKQLKTINIKTISRLKL